MATVTNRRQIVEVTSAGVLITLSDAILYTIKHTGYTTAATPTLTTSLLAIGNDNQPTGIDFTAEDDKAPLAPGDALALGFGPQKIYAKSSADNLAVLVIPGEVR